MGVIASRSNVEERTGLHKIVDPLIETGSSQSLQLEVRAQNSCRHTQGREGGRTGCARQTGQT